MFKQRANKVSLIKKRKKEFQQPKMIRKIDVENAKTSLSEMQFKYLTDAP